MTSKVKNEVIRGIDQESTQAKISVIREENEGLREQLKQLCDYLSKELERKKVKKTNNTTENEDPNKLRLFLEQTVKNNDKQLKYYRAIIGKKQAKEEDNTPVPQRIEILKTKIKSAEDEMAISVIKVKELEGINKILEKEELLVKDPVEFMKNINLLTIEINALRAKSEKFRKNLQIDHKNFKKQQEFLKKLELKYEELCRNLAINPDLPRIKQEIEENTQKNLIILQKFKKELKNLGENQNSTRFLLDDLIRGQTEKIVKKKRYLSVKAYKDDKDELIEAFDTRNSCNAEKNFNLMRNKIKTLRNIVKNEEKTQQKIIYDIKGQTVDLEFENKLNIDRIKEKEKEIALANEMFNNLKKNTKFNALTPLNISMSQSKELLLKEKDFTNKSLIVKNSDSRKRHTKRDSSRALLSQDVVFFDDIQLLGPSTKHTIKTLTFFLYKTTIVGLQAIYLKNNEEMFGYRNVMKNMINNKEITEVSCDFAQDDYIRNLYGLYGDWIEYLRIDTVKGKVFEVGVVNTKEKIKDFTLNIRNFDVPITIFGALDIKKGGNCDEYVLTVIGIEMKNELAEKQEARNKELLTKSLIAKDLLSLSNSSEGEGDASEKKQGKKKFLLKKSDNLLIKEENDEKNVNKKTNKEKNIVILEDSDEKNDKNKGKNGKKEKKDDKKMKELPKNDKKDEKNINRDDDNDQKGKKDDKKKK